MSSDDEDSSGSGDSESEKEKQTDEDTQPCGLFGPAPLPTMRTPPSSRTFRRFLFCRFNVGRVHFFIAFVFCQTEHGPSFVTAFTPRQVLHFLVFFVVVYVFLL